MSETDNTMKLARFTTAMMSAFDAGLGGMALFKPKLLEKLLGFEDDGDAGGTAMLQRTGFIWLAYSAAHCVAYSRGRSGDWTTLAWMRAMEVPADPIWALRNKKRLSKLGMGTMIGFTPAVNIAYTALFAAAAKKTRELEASTE